MTNLLMASKLFGGLFVFILGMLVVFFGIALIVWFIEIIGKIMSAKKNKENKENKENVQPAEETTVSDYATAEDEELSSETVAVITAALTAYYFKENSNCEFKIKKIKRIF